MEHGVFDLVRLEQFMPSLVDGGPTNSGHRTPAVIVEMSMDGISADVIRANRWHFRQILTRGVHGILRCHAENPEAVKDFVEVCRTLFRRTVLIPTSKLGDMVLSGNRRQRRFGFSVQEYLDKADPWPLGELLLGLNIAEWSPGDMSMSFVTEACSIHSQQKWLKLEIGFFRL